MANYCRAVTKSPRGTLLGFLTWFTLPVFDYGVAFTGFSRVVYSPMFVLGVAFTGCFYLVCSKVH
jgi:hypothetical protein